MTQTKIMRYNKIKKVGVAVHGDPCYKELLKKRRIRTCKTLEALQEYTHTHTLCLLEDKSLKNLGLVCIVEKLYIRYKNIKDDMQLLHRQTVF